MIIVVKARCHLQQALTLLFVAFFCACADVPNESSHLEASGANPLPDTAQPVWVVGDWPQEWIVAPWLVSQEPPNDNGAGSDCVKTRKQRNPLRCDCEAILDEKKSLAGLVLEDGEMIVILACRNEDGLFLRAPVTSYLRSPNKSTDPSTGAALDNLSINLYNQGDKDLGCMNVGVRAEATNPHRQGDISHGHISAPFKRNLTVSPLGDHNPERAAINSGGLSDDPSLAYFDFEFQASAKKGDSIGKLDFVDPNQTKKLLTTVPLTFGFDYTHEP